MQGFIKPLEDHLLTWVAAWQRPSGGLSETFVTEYELNGTPLNTREGDGAGDSLGRSGSSAPFNLFNMVVGDAKWFDLTVPLWAKMQCCQASVILNRSLKNVLTCVGDSKTSQEWDRQNLTIGNNGKLGQGSHKK